MILESRRLVVHSLKGAFTVDPPHFILLASDLIPPGHESSLTMERSYTRASLIGFMILDVSTSGSSFSEGRFYW